MSAFVKTSLSKTSCTTLGILEFLKWNRKGITVLFMHKLSYIQLIVQLLKKSWKYIAIGSVHPWTRLHVVDSRNFLHFTNIQRAYFTEGPKLVPEGKCMTMLSSALGLIFKKLVQ